MTPSPSSTSRASGDDYRRVVLEGTDEEQLSQGPGHYIGTALPGQPGNVALPATGSARARRSSSSTPLRPGDPIVVETADSWFVYRVLGDRPPATSAVTRAASPARDRAARPPSTSSRPCPAGRPRAPTGAFLTLTTCHPRFSAEQRLIIHAALDGAPIAKADAPGRAARPPRALRGPPCTAGSGAGCRAGRRARRCSRCSCRSPSCALLLFVVFPWAEPHLPFNEVTVDG